MKGTIEPNRLKNIISSAMVDGLIDPIRMTTNEKGLIALNATDNNDLISIIYANKDYFLNFEANEKQEVTFGPEVLKRLGWGFKKDELTINANEKEMELSDGTDTLPVELSEKIDKKIPIPISKTEYGFFLDYNLYNELQKDGVNEKPKDWNDKLTFEKYQIYKTEAENLKFPGNPTNYKLNLKDGKISVTIPGTSTSFIHVIEGEHKTKGDYEVIVDAEAFKSAINNLEGTVYLIFNELTFSLIEEKHKNLKKTFCLGTKEEL